METTNHPPKSYKFDFWKDRFWIWALALPFGLVCWAIPFVLLIGLMNAGKAPAWFPYFGFVFLGLPAYLVGWIFVYSLMEGIYTKVTLAESWVSIRLPWLVFPLIPTVKRIDLERVRRVNLFAAYGSRTAVFLYYMQKNKERHFYLPKFKYDPAYLQMMVALKDRIEPPPVRPVSPTDGAPQGMLSAKDALLKANRRPGLRPHFIENILNSLIAFSLLGMVAIGGWITLSLPGSSKTDAFSVGFSLAFLCFWLALCGLLPGIGQVAFWFLGQPVIRSIMWLLQVPDVGWDTPPVANQLLARWNIPPVHSTLVEFLFWAVLIISIELSLIVVLGWLRRRAYKSSMVVQNI